MVVQDIRTDMVSSPLKSDKKHRLKQRFDVQRKLGQGTYGKVQLAVNRETGQEVAIKTIKKSKIGNDQDLVRIRREIQIMSSIQHPHITHIYEVFENKDKIVLVMQFASGGELYDYLSEKKVLPDLEARRIFRQIAAAVYYCHKNKICHRDLKLENILLDEKGNAKIADFGLSNVFDEKHLLNTSCGSPLYASPEIVLGLPYYGPEVDCWSMGVLLYTLVYGAMPFDGSNFKKLVLQISEGDYFEPKNKSKASELIRRLLTANPSKRATIVDICMDCWVNLGYEHSLLQVAEDMANLTPVRLDLLLALAPEDPAPPREEDERPPEDEQDDDEEEEEETDNPDTAANSFAFVKGGGSQLSVSTPDLQKAVEDSGDEFLPADVAAALQEELQQQLGSNSSSLRTPSPAGGPPKKPARAAADLDPSSKPESVPKSDNDAKPSPGPGASKVSSPTVGLPEIVTDALGVDSLKKSPTGGTKDRRESLTSQDEKADSKRFVRPPGKIIIPKTFDSPQTTPSPKATTTAKKFIKSDSKLESNASKSSEAPTSPVETQEGKHPQTTLIEDINRNWIEPQTEDKKSAITEEKKNIAKGILKKGIAKAKLAERKMSKQGSTESETTSPCSTPTVTCTPDPKPSFFKAPRPYTKGEDDSTVMSQAEIKLSSTQSTLKSDSPSPVSAPLWDKKRVGDRPEKISDKRSSSPDSMVSNWREQMEESLRRLSPEDERSSNPSFALSRVDDEKPLVPIARSYKKFTFTKDGACITETKKVYATPGADGSWTKVEKKTKITTRPGNAEEFERFRDMHLRTDTPSVARSDSQSSSGSNDVYDDIFDSWTGDTMMCNMRKMSSVFQKFSRDPFLRRERRRNPFRFFRRAGGERSVDRDPPPAPRGRGDAPRGGEDDGDYDVHFDDSSAVVYGSQGLWQLLRTANRGFPVGRASIRGQEPCSGRSASQDRSEMRFDGGEWKRAGSRTSSGYNTGTRSQSRDRTESPREKVLRFVFSDSPRESFCTGNAARNEKWSMKRNPSRHNPRRDSGVGSDGYESEYSIRHSPSDEMSRTGRVSSMSSMCSDKQSLIRNFMRSWSKDYMSPPVSPSSLGSAKEELESLPESRRNRVEQWLDKNAEKGPFGVRVGRESAGSGGAPSYATVRPREYLHYNRSSSDKLAECAGFFSAFDDDSPRGRVHRDSPPMRFRTSTYSPVSEESLRGDGHSAAYHSDGSGSSVHRINFTFSDGRASSSPQAAGRCVRQFSTTSREGGCITVESSPPTSATHPPVVQMRVSINRGGGGGSRESPVLLSSPPSLSASKGLWDQQCTDRSPSPVPGIRQFSTEVQHCVGAPEKTVVPLVPMQCDADKKTPSPVQTGKSGSPYKYALPAEGSVWETACPALGMESSPELTNINRHAFEPLANRHYPSLGDANDRPSDLLPTPDSASSLAKSPRHPVSSSNGADTPDSLEDHPVVLMATKMMHSTGPLPNGPSRPAASLLNTATQGSDRLSPAGPPLGREPPPASGDEGLHVKVKPLGALWGRDSQVELREVGCNRFVASVVRARRVSTSSSNSEEAAGSDELQRRCLEKTTPEVGGVWKQKGSGHTFDLLKDLLSDDGLDSFRSSRCVADPSDRKSVTTGGGNENGRPPRVSLIGDLGLECLGPPGDARFRRVPSLMDDLQSPKEVLRQALKICDSMEKCK